MTQEEQDRANFPDTSAEERAFLKQLLGDSWRELSRESRKNLLFAFRYGSNWNRDDR